MQKIERNALAQAQIAGGSVKSSGAANSTTVDVTVNPAQ